MMFSATLSKEICPVCKKFMQDILGNMKKDPASLMLFTVTKKLHKLGYVLKIYPLEDGKARSMWEEIGAQISILSPDRYGHIDWSIFEGIIVNSLGAKDAISRYVRRIVF
ncbi:DEAD-box ATP-dependent RNA helicase 56-like isoform X2 [Camellia sinensis]|uniref:DEAD-box ATP-dependent RNA helicase 56-like isoform X2 n=1 Tax=Camellia sinensis TaxID=4442 RepID=UPI001035C791|nr:DEAD-box ATP-dependent RNA helicase 56-like isoform X2 [Camellia sinensis]XP_028095482.1 DEAD-box ATP-dependent RNA helicase 56-like isoform X2 [Camellia sinensis]